MAKQTRRRYQLTITDDGSDDKNIEILLTDSMKTRRTVDALIPALNQLKQTLAEDMAEEEAATWPRS